MSDVQSDKSVPSSAHLDVALLDRFLACPTCKAASWSDAGINRDVPLAPEGHITCTACTASLGVRSGVVIASSELLDLCDNSQSASVYSRYWNMASDHYDSEGYGAEDDVLQQFTSDIADKTLLDAGCGDGRHLASWQRMEASAVICLDVSQGIFLARRRQIALGSDTPSLFILGSLLSIPLRDKSVQTLWSSGTLILIDDQRTAMIEMARTTRSAVLLGVTSNNALGTIYQRLNIIRPLCRFLFRVGVFTPITWTLAVLLYGYSTLSVRLGKNLFPFTLESAKRIAQSDQGVRKLQAVLNEPFISPNILRKTDAIYHECFEQHGFEGHLTQSEFLIDYFRFIPK